jgi:YgiT-type zinc finger domain-containing protein
MAAGANSNPVHTEVAMEGELCPICGEGKLYRTVTNAPFRYRGRVITIPDYVCYRCPQCQESFVDEESLKSSGQILAVFKKKADQAVIP